MFQRTATTEEIKPTPSRVLDVADLRGFDLRDLYHFDEDTVPSHSGSPQNREHVIRIVPDEEVLLQRIVMHHSIARHLRLRGIAVGGQPLRGRRAQSGTCEIFYAEVPNWTPQGVVFSPDAPLEIRVRNENERPWLLAGSVVVLRRSRSAVMTSMMNTPESASGPLAPTPRSEDD